MSGMIFSFLVVALVCGMTCSIAKTKNETKVKRMMIEATLREEEMKRGYPPGTYSRTFSSKAAYKEMKKMDRQYKKSGFTKEYHDDLEREHLEKGINDLEERIKNLDEILGSRRNNNGNN